MTSKKVGFIYSRELANLCNLLHVHPKQLAMTTALMESCNLIQHFAVVSAPVAATFEEMALFHDQDYLQALQQQQQQEEFALVDDCYVFQQLYRYCTFICGASLTAAKLLQTRQVDIAINWAGGRHHAKANAAAGFCYVNDVVLAICQLQQTYSHILCIDIDIHHGDGTEEAFYYSSSVFTLSFHKLALGFFPGTGQQKCVGQGDGRYCNLNVPLDDGITDEQFHRVFKEIVAQVVQAFPATCITMVCGMDTLARDPLGTFNLTADGISSCVQYVKELDLPLLLLGGGGYNMADSARAYTQATATVLLDSNIVGFLPSVIPEHAFFTEYGPDYSMKTRPVVHRENRNSVKSIETTCSRALRQIQKYINYQADVPKSPIEN